MIFYLFTIIISILSVYTQSNFDYIIVGAGAGGSMVGMRLAEKGYSVLILEAGPDYMSGNISTPALYLRSSEDANIAWDFMVNHYETNLRGPVLYPRATGVGGCTLHNALIHVMPTSLDFDNMVKLTGDDRWSEGNMRRYYQEIAQPTIIEKLPTRRLLGQLGTTFQKFASLTTNLFSNKQQAWLKLTTVNIFNLLAKDTKLLDLITKILQIPLLNNFLGFDINDGQHIDNENTFLVPMNVSPEDNMKRIGIYERLKYVQQNYKLTIWTHTLVSRILLDQNNVAYGVEYIQEEYIYKANKFARKSNYNYQQITCNKEIIVSAGTFNTPQLMMLSGIGDPNHLQQMNIMPKVNLPGVGRNLHDRYEISLNYKFGEEFTILSDCLLRADTNDPCYNRFVETASGPYTFNGVLAGITKKSSSDLKVPDLFTLIAPIYFTGYHHGMAEEAYYNKNILTFLILKAYSNNRAGYIKLNSNDPTDVPYIQFNYFNQNENMDLYPIIKAIKEVRQIMSQFNADNLEILPGLENQSDEQLINYIKRTAWGHHATGTMKMGHDNDNMAVLNNKFQVRGTGNLRVVDLSIFPDIPAYFPSLFLYLTGALAADVITEN